MRTSPSLGFARPGGAPPSRIWRPRCTASRTGGLTLLAPLPVYAPPGCAERLAGFFGRSDTAFLNSVFDVRTLCDGHTVRHRNLTLAAHAVVHDVESYGLRAECQGRVFAYSGDSGPCEALSRLVGGADLFLCEADVDTHREGEPRVHLTPEEAGTYAKSARRLLITHGGPRCPGRGRPAGRPWSSAGPPRARARARPGTCDFKIM